MAAHIGSSLMHFGWVSPRPESGPIQFHFMVLRLDGLADSLKGKRDSECPKIEDRFIKYVTDVKSAELENICDRIGFFKKEKIAIPKGKKKKILDKKLNDLILPLFRDRLELHEAVPRILSAGVIMGQLAGRVLKPDTTIDRLFLAFSFEDQAEDSAFLPYLRLGQEHWVKRLASEGEPLPHLEEVPIYNIQLCILADERINQMGSVAAPSAPVAAPVPPPVVVATNVQPAAPPPSIPLPKPLVPPKESVWGTLWSGVGAVFGYLVDLLKAPLRWFNIL